jgi:sugar O-acyltransferase (sialic acid O-acetyltransferase NeuD family)
MPVVIVGAGGHGRELLDIVEAVNRHEPTFEFLGFLDDDERDRETLRRRGVKVLGPVKLLAELDVCYALGLGSGGLRRKVDAVATRYERVPVTLRHPVTTIGSDVRLGPGTVMAAGSRITTNVTTGRHVHLNIGATVSHDCVLHDYATLSPGVHLSGNVTLADEVFLGTGAVVIPGVSIGSAARIGAGAAVVGDVPAGVLAVGVPARIARDASA